MNRRNPWYSVSIYDRAGKLRAVVVQYSGNRARAHADGTAAVLRRARHHQQHEVRVEEVK